MFLLRKKHAMKMPLTCFIRKKVVYKAKMLANKRKFAKTKRVNECNDAKQARLARKRECDKSQRATETIDEKKVQLAKKRQSWIAYVGPKRLMIISSFDCQEKRGLQK